MRGAQIRPTVDQWASVSHNLLLTISIPPLYTVIVSGEKLVFTQDQFESDPGNYFMTYFFGGFGEAAQGAHEWRVEKEPKLFQLIQAHIRG
jgi:hypothetical protein